MTHRAFKQIGRNLRSIEDPALRQVMDAIISNLEEVHEDILAILNPDPPAWVDMTLQNSWTQITTEEAVLPQYFKDMFHFVHLRGVIADGTKADGTVITQLPAGYRPSKIVVLPLIDSGGAGKSHLHIRPDGGMEIYGVAGGTEVAINCCFAAES